MYITNKLVRPKKEALAGAREENKLLSENLAIKEAELQKVTKKVDDLMRK